MPSMPLFFWGDEDGERLRESYFSMYPGVWRHGDWIRITPRGGAVIYGRSDSTINRQGVRMGTSEIYRAAGAVAEVLDALVVDIPRGRRGRAVDGAVRRAARRRDARRGADAAQIKRRIREDCSPRHVPNEIRQIEEVPRTLSGKVLEVPVKRILMGAPRARRRASTRSPTRARSTTSWSSAAELDVGRRPPARRGGRRGHGRRHAGPPRARARAGRPIYSPIERPTISFMISFAPP